MSSQSQPQIASLSFEHAASPLAIGHEKPRLSWRFASAPTTAQDWKQGAYELQVRRGDGDEPESYYVESAQSVLVPWPSAPLQSRDTVRVRVRAYGEENERVRRDEGTQWSAWLKGEASLLRGTDWKAKPIAGPAVEEDGPLRPVLLRKSFRIPRERGAIAKARLYITACGVYEAHVNGTRMGNEAMAPGWTSYKHRLNYQVYDISSDLLRLTEDNIIGVEVGEGWYAGRLAFDPNNRYIYGKDLASLVQLEIAFADSKDPFTVLSDESWLAGKSAIIRGEIYDGEFYDMREEQKGWNKDATTFDDSSWTSVRVLPPLTAELVAPDAPPVTVTEEVSPKDIFKTRSGKVIVDFGQNLVGKIRLRTLSLPSGQELSFAHAEVLEDGELGTRPLRTARCTDTIVFSGEELRDWSPKFTFHGFRYVQVDGWQADSGLPSKSDLVALVLHSNMQRTGWFSCSDDLVNKLHENVVWSMRGNFLSIPTDCPQRDERLGWTGDIQAFCRSANFLYDTAGMLGNWLQDLAVEQVKDEPNMIPGIVVPNVIRDMWPPGPQAVWHDCAVLVPWDLYNSFGDVSILRRQYESMRGWVDRGIRRGEDGLWDPDISQLGDWLDPSAPSDDASKGHTDGGLVADAYLVRVTSVLSRVSDILGHTTEAKQYANDAERIKSRFQYKYITPAGLLLSDSQTALSLALTFSLHSSTEQHTTAAARLARLVRLERFRISTGFVGTPLVTHALTLAGEPQLAYRMLLERGCPSWLYPVTMGATTVWERWDSMLPNGAVNPGSMTSFNHYALGSVANWLHATVGGISPLVPGWRTVKVQPVPGGTLTSADVRFESPYGTIACAWSLRGRHFEMSLEVPPNATALVILPDQRSSRCEAGNGEIVGSGHRTFSCTCELAPWPEEIVSPFRLPEE